MSWVASTNTIAGYDFYIQSDSDWAGTPSIAKHTPIGASSSTFQFVNSPSKSRTISGYMISKSDYDDLVATCESGASVVFSQTSGSVAVIIKNINGSIRYAANLSYLSLVAVTMDEYE